MRALHECRLEDIGRFDRVKIECQCGRTVLLPPSALEGLPNDLPVLDLKPRLRCDGCRPVRFEDPPCSAREGHEQGCDASGERSLRGALFLRGGPSQHRRLDLGGTPTCSE